MFRAIGLMVSNHDEHKVIPKPNFGELASDSNFTKLEIKILFQRFCSIAGPLGFVEIQRFATQPELVHCPVASLLCTHIMERKLLGAESESAIAPATTTAVENSGGKVAAAPSTSSSSSSSETTNEENSRGLDFPEFVSLLSILSPKAERAEKLASLWDLVVDDNGPYVSKSRFREVIACFFRGAAPQCLLDSLSENVFGLGMKVGRDKFSESIYNLDLDNLYTVTF